jgi:predicted RNase H-like HicB family nuclease
MKTYSFRVIIEPREDRWHAYCPQLEHYGAVSWGNTKKEACNNIQEVVRMVVKELIEDGVAIPIGALDEAETLSEPEVAVTLSK